MNSRTANPPMVTTCEQVIAELVASEPAASAVACRLHALAQQVGENDISHAVQRELDGYRDGEPLPPGVESISFASRLGLSLLEAKISQTEVGAGGATTDPLMSIQLISRAVERDRLRAVLQTRREHLASLATELLIRIAPTGEKWLISVHGIQTRGEWQKELASYMEQGLRYLPFDYRWFDAFRLLSESSRDSRIDEFRDRYDRFIETHGVIPSIVAHSFGSYIVTRAVEKYGLRFDRVILCGSIVRRDYPWSVQFDTTPARVNRVLNDFGGRDIWARLAAWVIMDAGQSGLLGFDDAAGGRVLQRGHSWYRHSDYFFAGNYRDRWIPFILGQDPPDVATATVASRNWRNNIARVALAVIAAAFVLWLLKQL